MKSTQSHMWSLNPDENLRRAGTVENSHELPPSLRAVVCTARENITRRWKFSYFKIGSSVCKVCRHVLDQGWGWRGLASINSISGVWWFGIATLFFLVKIKSRVSARVFKHFHQEQWQIENGFKPYGWWKTAQKCLCFQIERAWVN